MSYRPTGKNVLIERIAAQKEIAGMQVGAKAAKDKAELNAKQQLEGLKIGADIAHNRAQLHVQRQANTQKGTQKKDE